MYYRAQLGIIIGAVDALIAAYRVTVIKIKSIDIIMESVQSLMTMATDGNFFIPLNP